MDARDLLATKAKGILRMLPEDDQEIVYAHFDQEGEAAFQRGKRMSNIGGILTGFVILGFLGGATAFVIAAGTSRNADIASQYEALREACIERVLCPCKDFPVEAP